MNTTKLFEQNTGIRVYFVWLVFLLILIVSEILANSVQRDFGRVEVSNVTYKNINDTPIRAKLLKPKGLTSENPAPGVVYIHGYQNNRETSDAYVIEMARRGFVVLSIDAIGRGNSGNPGSINDPNFDPSYGGQASLEYLKKLPYVDRESIGLMGHSLGAEMVYNISLEDESIKALVISGYAYTTEATNNKPKNMLMIFGEYDEYRERMTGTRNVRDEWMSSSQTQAAIGSGDYDFGITYGSFKQGTARKVVLLPAIHLKESHSRDGVSEAVTWMKAALNPNPKYWIDAGKQIWVYKEYATLVAMFSGLFSVLPLGLILLKQKYFQSLQGIVIETYNCDCKGLKKHASINGFLMWLYLPLIFALFGLHVYVVPIDQVFPMMLVNGTVWWFLIINLIGFIIFRNWFKKENAKSGIELGDLGISFGKGGMVFDWNYLGKTFLLGLLLFIYTYSIEHILEAIFIVDYRFIFPFASDLTPYRFVMWLLYFPFMLVGFLQLGNFLHGQIRIKKRKHWLRTFLVWSQVNTVVMVLPLMIFLLFQYIPIYFAGFVPFVGPGGMLASYTMNLFHIIGVLIFIIPVQTWFFQLTARPYLGAILNASIVTWMFVSSQVIAPIPI